MLFACVWAKEKGSRYTGNAGKGVVKRVGVAREGVVGEGREEGEGR